MFKILIPQARTGCRQHSFEIRAGRIGLDYSNHRQPTCAKSARGPFSSIAPSHQRAQTSEARLRNAIISAGAKALGRLQSVRIWGNLSRRLLLLTIAFVMLAEILIFAPSVARFRADYLLERLQKAEIAVIGTLAAPQGDIAPGLAADLLQGAEVWSIVVQSEGKRAMLLMRPEHAPLGATYDLREAGFFSLIGDALMCAARSEHRLIRVIGDTERLEGDHLEITVDEWALKKAMLLYGLRILGLSLLISAITATLVFWAVNRFLVRPMRRITDGVVSFRRDPEDPSLIFAPSGAGGEIGEAERELAQTQAQVYAALKQKSRLAALGAAVAKINHDLRNILASAQLFADRLDGSSDPVAKRIAPKLIGSLDRAIRLCRQTLEFGRADEPAPDKRMAPLSPMLDDIAMSLGLDQADGAIQFENRAAANAEVRADPDQLHRALLNICRNAAQAMEGRGGVLAIELSREGARDRIDVIDTGPGVPERAKEKLFEAFQGSLRPGGSGLGLAIAAELARGHGGVLSLVESSENGARFRLELPVAAEEPTARSREIRARRPEKTP